MKERLYENLEEVIEEIYSTIININGEDPYVLFGHSMGSLVIYELAKKLECSSGPKPLHIFLSARKAPNQFLAKQIYDLPDEEFIEEILKFGGMNEIMKDKQLLDIFLPILRKDIQINETYRFNNEDQKLRTAATLFYGSNDIINLQDAMRWQTCLEQQMDIYEIEGGHFFIRDQSQDVINVINTILSNKKLPNIH